MVIRRPSFVYWTSLWGSCIAFALTLLALDFRKQSIDVSLIVGRDFSNMWTSGWLALDTHAYRAFDPESFRLAISERLDILTLQNFSYPPHALFLNAPFALLPYYTALILWSAVGLGLFALAAKSYLPSGFSPYLAVCTPAAALCLWDGQFGLFLGALWLWVFSNLDRRPTFAGAIAGIMTLKPHLGLLIAVILLRNPKAVLAAIATTAALIAASSLVFGVETWFGFLSQTTAEQFDILTRSSGDFYFKLMVGSYVAFGQGPVGILAQLATGGFAASKLWSVRKLETRKLAFAMATATFLIVPYAFNYDMTVVCLGFNALLYTHWKVLSRWEVAALTAAFAAPPLSLGLPALVPILMMIGLHLQCRILLREFSHTEESKSADRSTAPAPC